MKKGKLIMNTKIIKATTDDKDYISLFNLSKLENVYIIYKDSLKCGIVEFWLKDGYICLELLEIQKPFRRLGIGRTVINYLLKNYGDIFGDCAPNWNSANFWIAMGAEFDENLEEGIEYKTCIPFVIYS